MTRLCAVIGWPVAQSLSPAIHNAAFDAVGLDWAYVPMAVEPGAAGPAVALLRDLDAAGANVTMPHKATVIPFLDALAPDAEALGAVNTIVRDGDRMVGHNTDGDGFLAWLRADLGIEPAGQRALVLGAGGAARAVAAALARAGARVTVGARRIERAAELARLEPGIDTVAWGEPAAADLIVNATPARAGLPLASMELGPGVRVVDLIYPPPDTELVVRARAAGAAAWMGLGMLLHQAALAFRLWTGRDAPLDVMRAAAGTEMERLSGPERVGMSDTFPTTT